MSKEYEVFKYALEVGYKHSEYVELKYINIPDEYEDYVNERNKDMSNIDINFDEDLLFKTAMEAHEQDITLNEYILNIIEKSIGELS